MDNPRILSLDELRAQLREHHRVDVADVTLAIDHPNDSRRCDNPQLVWQPFVTREGRIWELHEVNRRWTTAEPAIEQALLSSFAQPWYQLAVARGPVTREELAGEWSEYPLDERGSTVISYKQPADGLYAEVRKCYGKGGGALRGGVITNFIVDGQCCPKDRWEQFNLLRGGDEAGPLTLERATAMMLRYLRVALAFREQPVRRRRIVTARVQCTSCNRTESVLRTEAIGRVCGNCGQATRVVHPETGEHLPAGQLDPTD